MTAPTFGQILCPVVVGRDAELGAFERLLADARDGRGGLIGLVGEPGIGKSRLTREAQRSAEASGMIALRGRAAPSKAPIPYRAVAEALTAALGSRDATDDPDAGSARRTLRGLIPGQGPARAPEPSVPVIHDAVARLLRALARDGRGVLLVLEDLHWADADTLSVVDYLSDTIAQDPILCIVTIRDDPGPALALVEAMAARRVAHRFALARLSADETAEMARLSLDTSDLPGALVEALIARAEGVPFVVEEMLTAYVSSSGETGAASTLPHTYAELVRSRLAAVDDAARRTLFAAAILGRQFDWSLLSAVTGLDRQGVLDGLRVAVREKLVSSDPAPGHDMPFGFRHALVREAIVAELLPPEVRELSARAADAIEERHQGLQGEWCERVADLREAAGEPAAAARHLQEAAQRALVRGALASAESMLERARGLIVDDRWHRVGVDRQLVEVLSQQGKVDRLREIAASALEFVKEKREVLPFVTLGLGYLHLRLARGLAAAGDRAGAAEHAGHARDFANEVGETRLLARVHAFEAGRAFERGDIERALSEARTAREGAGDERLRDVLAEALSVEGRAAFLKGDATTALSTLRRARDETGDAVVPRIRALLDLGAVEASVTGDVSALEAARALAADAGAVSSEARAEMLMAEAAVSRFDLDEAAALVRRSIDTSRRYGLALLSEALAIDAERRALEKNEAEAEEAVSGIPSPSRAHLVLALRREDRTAAGNTAAGLPDDAVARAIGSLLAALGGTGSPRSATAHALAEGILAAAASAALPGARAADEYLRADAALQRFPWWRHIVRRMIGEAALAEGWGDGEAWIRESLTFFEDAGHDRVASACKAALRRAGAPVPRKGRGDSSVPAGLRVRGVTSREMDVLRLVARGFGNREIATQLFLSRRTVETHVTNLIRKLGVQTRAELAIEADAVPDTG